jgi:hypothetical protein
MGAFFGSVHIRSDDVAGVRRILDEIATRRETRFLLAPPRDGWLSIYPSDHGQDTAVSAEIAERIVAPILHLVVHDDDVFAYVLYDTGGPIDEYCSDPEYFEASSPARRQETAGRPEALAALAAIADSAELARVLDRQGPKTDPFRARWQLARVGELLGIANVETSYEYLREGETRGVKGWKDFVHVPDRALEKEAAKRQRAEVKAATRRLQQEGRLLVTKALAGAHPRFPPQPVFCPHPTEGFFLAWQDSAAADAALEWWRSPWQEPSDTGLRVNSRLTRMSVSPSGRFLAVGHAYGDWSATLFDLRQRQALNTLPLPRATEDISFSPDERTLICRSQGELRLVSTDDFRVLRSVAFGGGRSVAAHPDGRWVVADVQDGHSTGVALIDAGGSHRILRTRQHDFAAWMAAHAAGKATLTGFHPSDVPTDLAFTADGRLLLLAVNEGVRAYVWDDVLRAETDLPPPALSADSRVVRVEKSWLQNTYALVSDGRRGRVLFAAVDGCVHALDLESGTATVLVEIPGTPAVTALGLSADGETLATVAHPGLFSRGRRRPAPLWQVWNLAPGSAA